MAKTRLDALESVGSYILSLLLVLFIVLILIGKIKVAVVEGRSMEPTMHTGDLVILEKKNPDEIKVGDVVVYRTGQRYIIHRVIDISINNNNYCYVIKGDNNPVPDPGFPQCNGKGIPYNAIIGVVYSVDDKVIKIPYLGGISVIIKG